MKTAEIGLGIYSKNSAMQVSHSQGKYPDLLKPTLPRPGCQGRAGGWEGLGLQGTVNSIGYL